MDRIAEAPAYEGCNKDEAAAARRAARVGVAHHLIHVIRDRVPAGDRECVRAAGPLDMTSITDGVSRDAAAGPAHADRFGTCVVGRAGDGGVY